MEARGRPWLTSATIAVGITLLLPLFAVAGDSRGDDSMGSRLLSGAKQAAGSTAAGATEAAEGVAAGGAMAEAPATESLVDVLVRSLGVTPAQATGGAGAVFGLARQRMAPDAFAKVAGAVPGMDQLLAAAPAVDVAAAPPSEASGSGKGGMGGMLGSAAASLGASPPDLGAAEALIPAFSKLGLGPDMAGRFIPQILEFVGSRGGPTVAKLLQAALI
jgi:hypothetical protein